MGRWPKTPFNPSGNVFPRRDGAWPSDFAGKLPDTIARLNDWTGVSIWNVAHNFSDITGSPNTVNAMTGSSAFQLTRLGAADATVLTAPQAGYAAQAGIKISTSSQTLYRSSTLWPHSATIPTVYLLTFRFDATPTTNAKFLSGLAGDGQNGFFISAHPTSGIRFGIGTGGAGFVVGSYIGGTALYDAKWHTLALCIDDAAGKVKMACEAYSTESTALTIGAPASTFCTIGATYSGDPDWGQAVSYALSARGHGAAAYTGFDGILADYEAARLSGTGA
jgi:hypothetical protein